MVVQHVVQIERKRKRRKKKQSNYAQSNCKHARNGIMGQTKSYLQFSDINFVSVAEYVYRYIELQRKKKLIFFASSSHNNSQTNHWHLFAESDRKKNVIKLCDSKSSWNSTYSIDFDQKFIQIGYECVLWACILIVAKWAIEWTQFSRRKWMKLFIVIHRFHSFP